ncbi:MAG: L-rhamnose/proton symporter RhaT [Candidatus Acidiferrales bacterium]
MQMQNTALGLILLIIAGAMNGSFTLPMKYTKRWAWENTWLAWTIFALFVLPPAVTFIALPEVNQVYAQSSWTPILIVAACGAGWGISQVFFGLAVEAVGIALAFSVILGIAAAVGSLVPLFRDHLDKIFTQGSIGVLIGVGLVIAGVTICAAAGRRREAALGTGPQGGKASVGRGLLFCLFSGLGSALVAIGFDAGKGLSDASQHLGGSALWAPMAAWLPLMVAGGVPNLIYCLYLQRKNKTGKKFSESGTGGYWPLAFVMAICWFGSTVMYGMSTGYFPAHWGTVVAWPAFMSLIVITASVHGIRTGEWKGTGTTPVRIQLGGVAVLIIAVIVLQLAGQWVH